MDRTGEQFIAMARQHIGEPYRLGALAPKDDRLWRGPWDCAEFASWLTWQICGILFGCVDNQAPPHKADAYTGAWVRDARAAGIIITPEIASRTAGAWIIRIPVISTLGHVALSDGNGGTIEAYSTARGVIAGKISGRRWDLGALLPGVAYRQGGPPTILPVPPVLRFMSPMMRGDAVRTLQRQLQARGFSPGTIDGAFGQATLSAVVQFQAANGLLVDGEVGPVTAKALEGEI